MKTSAHCLSLDDFSSDQAHALLESAIRLKSELKAGKASGTGSAFPPLAGKTLAMIFEKPSNRTRVSFEVGMYQLGGHALNLRYDEIAMGKRETVADTSKVLSRYVDGVMARVFRHSDLVEFAEVSEKPVINGLSDAFHPCQALADMLSIHEVKGSLQGLTLAYVGDGNNVANSLVVAARLFGLSMRLATPKGYEVKLSSKEYGFEALNDPSEACEGADIVYTDVWASMGQEEESSRRRRDFQGFQVNTSLMALAAADAIFLHCLPVHRGDEVSAAVVDGPQSRVYDQAENRLHAQKAILTALMA